MDNENKKKAGKLATYATILLLMVIIVIIIAAMADSREQTFKTKLEETTQKNMTIQDEIVTLKDENYKLSKQLEKLNAQISSTTDINKKLDEIWALLKENKNDEAFSKYAELDANSIPEASVSYFEAVGEVLK